MPQFFVSPDQIRDKLCTIIGEDYHHLTRVRRVREDDILTLMTEGGIALEARIVAITEKAIVAEILDMPGDNSGPAGSPEETLSLTLYMSLLKGKNFDLVIQKAVEIGVTAIVPVVTERTVPDIGKKQEEKLKRWNRIALEAAKQSLRKSVPPVSEILSFEEAVSLDVPGLKLLGHTGAPQNLPSLLRGDGDTRKIHLLIGPEGGFSEEEVTLGENHGWHRAHFGASQLRAETAALVLASVIVYERS